jgi:hypothetical protein
LRRERLLYLFKNFVNHSVSAAFITPQLSGIFLFRVLVYSNANFSTSLADKLQ